MLIQIRDDAVIELHIFFFFRHLSQIILYLPDKPFHKQLDFLYRILFRYRRIGLPSISHKLGYLDLFLHHRLDYRPYHLLIDQHYIVIGNILYVGKLFAYQLQFPVNRLRILLLQVIDDFILACIGIIIPFALVHPGIPENNLVLARYNPVLYRCRRFRHAFIQIIDIRMDGAYPDCQCIIKYLPHLLLHKL